MNQRNDQLEEEELEALLREAGTRDEPSPEMTASVRSAVHAEWRAMVIEGRRMRRRWMLATAASVLGVVFAVALVFKLQLAPAADIATVAYVAGNVVAQDRAVGLGDVLRRNDHVRTDARSRASLKLGQDLSVRMDVDTSMKLVAADRVELEHGALYIDSRGQKPLLVVTDVGTVRHLGTQYQVRSLAGEIDVSVREGRIEVRNTRGSNTASAGERLRVTAQGDVSRTYLSRGDGSWSWATQAVPVPDIENETLAAFLDWIASETGREIIYASPVAQELANTIRLHGSIRGLDLDTALDVVLQTTELRRDQAKDEFIVITNASPGDSGNITHPTL
jgi:ferric-dicitrate binding protein FerR (iron transport regulator)